MSLDSKIESAKKRIRSLTLMPERPIIVNFSGGKDSSTALHVTLEALERVEAVFMDSSIMLPGSVDFVKRFCDEMDVRLHVANPVKHYYGSFFDVIRRKGYFPCISDSWCKKDLKLRPQRAYLRTIYGNRHVYKITGIRMFESTRRMKIYGDRRYIEPDHEHSGSFVVHPLIDWKNEDVESYLKSTGLPINPQYERFGISGCKWCPFYQKKIYERILHKRPNILDDVIELEREIGAPSVTGRLWLRDIKRSARLEAEGLEVT